jgi:hypothetical protein
MERIMATEAAATRLVSVNGTAERALGNTGSSTGNTPPPAEIQRLFDNPDMVETPVGDGATLTVGKAGTTTATPQTATPRVTTATPSATTSADRMDPLVNAIVIMATRLGAESTSEAEKTRYTNGIETLAGVIARRAASNGGSDKPAVVPVKPDTDDDADTDTDTGGAVTTGNGTDAASLKLVDAMVAIADRMGSSDMDAARMDRYSDTLGTLAMLVEKQSA